MDFKGLGKGQLGVKGWKWKFLVRGRTGVASPEFLPSHPFNFIRQHVALDLEDMFLLTFFVVSEWFADRLEVARSS